MRALVLGALLVQTLNAQVTDDFTVAATPAPLESDISSLADTGVDGIIDGGATDTDAPASVTFDDALGSQTTAPDPLDYTSELGDYTSSLPLGTADVIVSTSTESDDTNVVPTSTDDTFAFATPDLNGAISFDGTDWNFPADTAAATDSGPDFLNGFAVSTPSEDPAADPAATGRADDDSADFAADANVTGGGDGATMTSVKAADLEFPYTTDYADAATATSSEVVYDEDGNPIVPDAFAGLAASETSSDGDFSAATPTSLPGDDDGSFVDEPSQLDAGTTMDADITASATPISGDLDAPLITSGAADTSFGVGAQDYNDGTNSASYDGQDYDTTTDDSECPWWCLGGVNNNGGGYTGSYPSDIASPSSGNGGDGTDYPDNGNEYAGGDGSDDGTGDGTDYPTDTYPAVRKYLKRALRKRQSNGFAAFNWPSTSTSTAVSQGGIAAADYRSGCPPSCYGSSSSAGGSPITTDTAQSPFISQPSTTSTMDDGYSSGYDGSTFGVSSTGVSTPACGYGLGAACPDTSTPSSPSASLPSTINTETSTFLTLPSPSSSLAYYPASPSVGTYPNPSGVDYTGDTLAGVCPMTCNATYPNLNFCDITTSCTTTGGSQGRTYCACRAGYRASRWNAKDFTKQFHVPGLPYVYVAPGVVCDEVCGDTLCSEVLVRPLCQ